MRTIVRCCFALSLMLISVAAFGYGAVISIEELIAKSQLIVTGKVTSIRSEGKPQVKIATIEVDAVWKGVIDGKPVEYVASPGWYAGNPMR